MKLSTILKESVVDGTLISIDIQPEYQKWFTFDIWGFLDFINQNFESIRKMVFLYNGKETLDMISEGEYIAWLLDNGLEEDIIDRSIFYDKGYAFFRSCMDSDIDDDAISNFVRFMYENDITDSRDLTREMWAKYLREYRHFDRKEIFEFFKHSQEMIYIPEVMSFLSRFSNITLCGGSLLECLKEVEIALKALKKPYNILRRFSY